MSAVPALNQPRGLAALVLSAALVAGCASSDTYDATAARAPVSETSGSFVWSGDEGLSTQRWFQSGYTLVSPAHDVIWSGDQIRTEDGALNIVIERTEPTETGSDIAYRSGELVAQTHRGFGRYEVVMRPAVGAGLVSTFFLYTGASEHHAHNEINLNFPGRNTRTIAMSYVADGVRGPDRTVELPFDAATGFHLYAIEYGPEAIRWFVGEELVFETQADALAPPQGAMPIVANVWAARPSQYAWTGAPDLTGQATASYRCISFQAEGDNAASCSTLFAD